MPVFLAATSADAPDAGWGRLVALIVAGLLFWAGSTAHQRWKETRESPSPAALESGAVSAKPQVAPLAPGTTGTGGTTGGKRAAELDLFVASRAGNARTMEIVREAQRRFGASRRTVMRAIKKAQGGAA